MKRMLNSWLWAPLVMTAGILLLLVGCSSDTTAPKENPPPLSQEAVVEQAAGFTTLVLDLLDEFLVPGKETVIQDIFLENVIGQVTLDYRCDGPDGTEVGCTGSTLATDYVRIFTNQAPDPPLESQKVDIWQDFGEGPQVIATIKGSIEVYPYNNDTSPQSGTVNGSGTLASGNYTSTWAIAGVPYTVGGYPEDGQITYTSSPTVVEAAFDGTEIATLTVGGVVYLLNLDTGEVTPPE